MNWRSSGTHFLKSEEQRYEIRIFCRREKRRKAKTVEKQHENRRKNNIFVFLINKGATTTETLASNMTNERTFKNGSRSDGSSFDSFGLYRNLTKYMLEIYPQHETALMDGSKKKKLSLVEYDLPAMQQVDATYGWRRNESQQEREINNIVLKILVPPPKKT